MNRYLITLCFLVAGLVAVPAHPPEPKGLPPKSRPAWQRKLKPEDEKKVAELVRVNDRHARNGDYDKAIEGLKAIHEIFSQSLGPDHWWTVDARWAATTLKTVVGLRDDDRRRLGKAEEAFAAAGKNVLAGRFTEAEERAIQARDLREKIFGRKHPETAAAYRQLAEVLAAQSGKKRQEAVKQFRSAHDIYKEVCGAQHPDTAFCSNALGVLLAERGDPDAVAYIQAALDARLDAFGPAHTDTLAVADTLAVVLESAGSFDHAVEAREIGLGARRALFDGRSREVALGHLLLGKSQAQQGDLVAAERNCWTGLGILLNRSPISTEAASAYNNLAFVFGRQGRLIEAEQFLRRSIDIRAEVGPKNGLAEAIVRSNLAINLADQWKGDPDRPGARTKLAAAEQILQDLSDGWNRIQGGTLTERTHSRLAVLDSLANVLAAGGKLAQAEKIHRQCFEQALDLHGNDHPETALARRSLAGNLAAQGKWEAARAEYLEALRGLRERFGEFHPDTAATYLQLGLIAHILDRPEAAGLVEKASRGVGTARHATATSGPDRARLRTEIAAPQALAVIRAAKGQVVEAWEAIEGGLSPALTDDFGLGPSRSLTDAERNRERELREKYVAEARRLTGAAVGSAATVQVAELREKADDAVEQWLKYTRTLRAKYGPVVGAACTLREVQKQLPPDTAIIGWISLESALRTPSEHEEHWAYLVRSEGEPVWVRLLGSAGKRGWSEADKRLAAAAYWVLSADGDEHPEVMNPEVGTPGDWQTPAAKLYKLLFGSLERHLGATDRLPAVKHLVVLPSPLLASLPVEVMVLAGTGRLGWNISYSPSASFYTWLRERRPVRPRDPSLLVVGDPEPPKANPKAKLAAGGVVITEVEPKSNADRAGLKSGDVLVLYAGTPLATPTDLQRAVGTGPAAGTEMVVRRGNKSLTLRVESGKLGVHLGGVSPDDLAGGEITYKRLPAFGVAVKTVAGLLPSAATVLTGEKATPIALDRLATDSNLSGYTHLYFACHGRCFLGDPFNSSVVLSGGELLRAGWIRSTWKIDADVVTFGICDSALGRFDPSEGYTGLTQAALLGGARSVVATRWPVSGEPTALLLIRFHQNVLGKRPDGRLPMAKDEALREAKEWLRTLPDKERRKYFDAPPDLGTSGPTRPRPPVNVDDRFSFAHPRFWAGIVLVGDPH